MKFSDLFTDKNGELDDKRVAGWLLLAFALADAIIGFDRGDMLAILGAGAGLLTASGVSDSFGKANAQPSEPTVKG
jgi:hypothetical protein